MKRWKVSASNVHSLEQTDEASTTVGEGMQHTNGDEIQSPLAIEPRLNPVQFSDKHLY